MRCIKLLQWEETYETALAPLDNEQYFPYFKTMILLFITYFFALRGGWEVRTNLDDNEVDVLWFKVCNTNYSSRQGFKKREAVITDNMYYFLYFVKINK